MINTKQEIDRLMAKLDSGELSTKAALIQAMQIGLEKGQEIMNEVFGKTDKQEQEVCNGA